jgi:phosphoesterase RecJ-like protein
VDVSRVCAALGGGGHAKAAGFTSHLPVEETIAGLRAQL